MDIVFDKFDATGMYSKAGRISVEMFTILQLKDQIFSDQKKKIRMGMFDKVTI